MRGGMGVLPLLGFLCLTAGSAAGEALGPAYETETWPEARELVWANPGKGGSFRDARNWLEDGKPASARPDRETDLVLPASEKTYVVKASRGCYCRHITIEKNAAVVAAHGGGPFTVWGNCWVKEGGRVHFVDVVGPKHTYFRLDGGEWGGYRFTPRGLPDPWKQTASSHIHHKMQVTKFGGGSVEFIGNVGIGDEFYLSRGKMIVSGEFRYNGAGSGKGTFEIFDGATLELQSGGALAPHKARSSMNIFNMSIYRGGTLQAGSPERPLTADAYLRLGFEGKANSGRNGLYCGKGSKIRVFSADPEKARLVVTAAVHAGNPSAEGDSRGIEVHLGGDVELDGVLFDYVRAGGIRMTDLSARESWENVFYGPHNAARPEGLFAPLVVNTDIYYHDRKYMRFGRVLEGLNIMQRTTGEKLDIIYPTSGKIFTHHGRVKWAPGGPRAAEQSKTKEETKADPPEARQMLAKLDKAAAALKRKLRGKKATDPEMAYKYKREFLAIGRGALTLRKKYPDTESCRRAVEICKELGLKLPNRG
jgi:hypothetical protein